MSLTQDIADASYMITGYDSGCILINNERYTQSLVVYPDKLLSPWDVTDVSKLNADNLAAIFALRPEVVLLGTGDQLALPHPKIIALFSQYRIGLEFMTSPAACRTYGILVSEGRKAAAAIIFPGNH